jgi:heterodisulfide reductase subunit A2
MTNPETNLMIRTNGNGKAPPSPESTVRGKCLVIGGGIAGIQASLDMADAGFQVYLVERESSIGGRMSQLDKTFPTLDCSSCILTPKMADVATGEMSTSPSNGNRVTST